MNEQKKMPDFDDAILKTTLDSIDTVLCEAIQSIQIHTTTLSQLDENIRKVRRRLILLYGEVFPPGGRTLKPEGKTEGKTEGKPH